MKIKYFNVSCFLITTDKGVRIITDPYQYNIKPDNPPPDYKGDRPAVEEFADVVTMSHTHGDHNYLWSIKGVPQLYNGGAPAEIKGVKFSGVASLHDNYGENGDMPTRGLNGLIGIDAEGIRIWHMGDYGLQKRLYDDQLARIGRVDILMTPWGSFASGIISQLRPKVVLPMHHTSVKQVKDVKGFTDMTDKTSELEYTTKNLPSETKVIMLKPALEY